MIRHVLAVINPRYIFKSSVTGKIVSRAYALLHPRETYRMRLR